MNDDYLLSDNYASQGFFRKCILLGLWGRFTLYKYITCWLLTEGACILFGEYIKRLKVLRKYILFVTPTGLTHNGEDENGVVQWNGCENVKLSLIENTTEFNHYIQSFNINTNHWVAQYIYKRLKFLGNRYISQFASLLFLAIWHGFHSGYYVCFLFEFLVIYLERDVSNFYNHHVFFV